MTKEEEVQQMYVEFQTINANIKQFEKQNTALEQQLMELMVTRQTLEDLKKLKSKTEILVPISSGIYAKADIKDTDKFIVNVGANVTLNKDLESTKKIIEKQIEEIQGLQKNLAGELQKHTTKASVLEQEISKIASTMEK